MELVFELPVNVAGQGQRPSTQAVYELLKAAVLSGDLAPNSKLPPTRSAGRHFNLSRNSLVSIYERLADEGLVVSQRGSGTFVAAGQKRPSSRHADSSNLSLNPSKLIQPRWSSKSLARNIWFWNEDSLDRVPADAIELRPGLGDRTLFPFDEFRRSVVKTLRRMERSPQGGKTPQRNQGDLRLRQAIADHSALMRSLVCEADNVIVTAGAQQSFDLIARLFIEPHRTVVAVEDPCYPPLIATLQAAGAVICPVPVDAEGIVVDRIPSDARLVFVCPSNQFPLGITMSSERREELRDFARRHEALIVEDDYEGEFRTAGEPLKAIYGQESSDLVFYVGSFSKCMFPGVCLGYVIAPPWAVDPLVLAKNCTDWHSSSVIQAAAASFIADGHLTAHVSRMRAEYKNRRLALLDALAANLEGLLEPITPSYGMHLSAEGDPTVDWDDVADRARSVGIRLHSLSRYRMAEGFPGLLFAVGCEGEQRIRSAVGRLPALVR